MNGVISKLLFPTASRAAGIRSIFTKEYLGLAFLQGKEKEAHAKAGTNAVKIKDKFLKVYKQRGIKDLKRYHILNYMNLVEGEKDMANLSKVVEDFLAQAGDPKHKQSLLCDCIQTCYLRGDLKYSRIFSGGAFSQYFDKHPIAVLTHLQSLYNHGHYQELVDKYKILTKVKNAAYMNIVMASLCKIGTPEAYKQATHFLADEFLIPKEVDSSRAFELFAWFSIQMGHYDTALETLKKKNQPSNLNEKLKSVKASSKIRGNIILFALVKSGKVDICLTEMSIQLRDYSTFGFTPVYPSELIQGLEEAVKHDEKLSEIYKELQKDLKEKGTVEKATVEELVFRPIDRSPHSKVSDQDFTNPYYYKKKFTSPFNSKDFPNFKYL
jgi:hypothetical protein